MSKKIILFNGPPRAGKDTAVNELLSCYPKAEHIKFSTPLKEGLQKFFNVSDFQYLEDNKEASLPILLGKSWREVQISLSETWAKKVFGSAVFGKIVLNTIENSNNETFLISDSGFFEEAKPLIDYFGERNCLLVRLSRPGCDFSNDSRSYWSHNYKYLEEISIINNSSTVDLLYECMNKIDIWMEYK